MRKGIYVMIVLGIILFDFLSLHLGAEGEDFFMKGVGYYKLATAKKSKNDKAGELGLLKSSYEMFQKVISVGDYKPLIMSYSVYLRIQVLQDELSLSQEQQLAISFSPENLQGIEGYVKGEYDSFPLIGELDAFFKKENIQWDKTPLLAQLQKIAEAFQLKAKALILEAEWEKKKFNYQLGIEKLEQSKAIWALPEADVLLNECRLLDNKSKQCRVNYENAISANMFQMAFDILNTMATGVLSPDEIGVKRNKVEKLCSEYSYTRAVEKYKKRDLEAALKFVDDCLRYDGANAEAQKLKQDIRKRQKKFAFFFDSGSVGTFKLSDMNYNRNISTTNQVKGTNQNSLSGTNFKKSISLDVGFLYMFPKSSSSGIRASLSSIKQNWKYGTNFIFNWVWSDGRSRSQSGTMSEDAKASLTLINIDYVFQKNLVNDLYVNLYAGPTFYLSKVDLYSGIGFGDVWYHQDNKLYYGEWYPLKYHNNENSGGVGGNIGGGLEYKWPPFSAFLEFQYYLIPSKTGNWEVINQAYQGGLDHFAINNLSQLGLNLPDYKFEVNFSAFKIVAGARIYF